MEFTAPSGAAVIINVAPWKDAKALKKAIEKEMSAPDFLSMSKDVMLAAFLNVDSSDGVDRALWPCLIRCTRNGEKIVESTFDDIEARKDYYEITTACIKENLSPLVESLILKLSGMGIIKKQAQENQKFA